MKRAALLAAHASNQLFLPAFVLSCFVCTSLIRTIADKGIFFVTWDLISWTKNLATGRTVSCWPTWKWCRMYASMSSASPRSSSTVSASATVFVFLAAGSSTFSSTWALPFAGVDGAGKGAKVVGVVGACRGAGVAGAGVAGLAGAVAPSGAAWTCLFRSVLNRSPIPPANSFSAGVSALTCGSSSWRYQPERAP